MRPYFLLLAGIVCSFVACQKEPDESLLTPTTCKIDKIFYFDDGDPIDTIGFVYNGDQVSRVNYYDHYTTLDYHGAYIVKRNYFDLTGSSVVAFDNFKYNPDSTIKTIDFFLVDPGLPQPFLFYQYEFTYNAGKLSLLRVKVDTSGTGPEPYLESYFMYTGNNISQVQQYDLVNQAADTINYSFDAKQNYYSKQPNLWLSDNFFSDMDGFLVPFALSENNVVRLTNMQNQTLDAAYTETDKQHIATLSLGGGLAAKYNYKCQ